jgi:hypothetical protein
MDRVLRTVYRDCAVVVRVAQVLPQPIPELRNAPMRSEDLHRAAETSREPLEAAGIP